MGGGATYGKFSLSPRALDNPQMIHQHRGEQRFRRIREPGYLPHQDAPELSILPDVRGDVDIGQVFEVEDG